MTTFTLKCETFVRLASICDFFESTVDDETKRVINTVRLENKAGHSYAIATNQKIAAVEYLGGTVHPDGVTHVKLTKELIDSLKKDNSLMTVTLVSFISASTLQTMNGFTASDVCYWFDETPLDNWSKWIVPNATESKRPMYWNLFQVESLIKASPTGKVVFPEFIDASKPVTVKDVSTYDWVGLFIPEDTIIADEAKVPEWWVK